VDCAPDLVVILIFKVGRR